MKLVEANSIMDNIFHLHKNGQYPGMKTGWKSLDELYSVRRGNTTIITGYPTSGKTTFYLNLLVNLTKNFGWKHCVYSPETGTASEIYAELIFMLTGKTFNKTYQNYITEKELYNILPMVQEYFKVIEPEDTNNTLDNLYSEVDYAVKTYNINSFGIDNWNDIEHNMIAKGTISEYLKHELPKFNRFAKTRDVHGFCLVHPRNPDPLKQGEQLQPPRPDQIEGGSLWYAKAQSLIVVHRNWDDPTNFNTLIKVEKAKPKIVGKKGQAILTYYAGFGIYKDNEKLYKQVEEKPF